MHQNLRKIECEVIDNNNVAGVCEKILIEKKMREQSSQGFYEEVTVSSNLLNRNPSDMACGHADHRPLWLERGDGFREGEQVTLYSECNRIH